MPKDVSGTPHGARGEKRSLHALLCPPHVSYVMYALNPLHKVKKLKMKFFKKNQRFEHTSLLKCYGLDVKSVHGLKLLVSYCWGCLQETGHLWDVNSWYT